VAVAAQAGRKEIVRALLDAGADPLALVERLHARQGRKDGWERLASLSGVFTFISSVLIAAVGWYFTSAYNERQHEWNKAQAAREQESREHQNRLAEMQTVEKMIPHLAKDEPSKQAALVALSVLASPRLASRFAEVYGGQGSVQALTQIAAANPKQATPAAVSALTAIAAREGVGDAGRAREALGTVLAGKERAIVKLVLGSQPICNGFVADAARGWIVTASYCLASRPGDGGASRVTVQGADGTPLRVVTTRVSANRLVALVQVESPGLPELSLAGGPVATGDSVLQIAYDLLAPKPAAGALSVVLGRVVSIGPVDFHDAAASAPVKATGITARLQTPSTLAGTGGGPLLDREGNVACMTYQAARAPGGPEQIEQCVPAIAVRLALDAARAG
jgi:hypothetical protein